MPASPLPRLIDIGVNLGHDSFDVDRHAVIERAVTSGVARMIVTGTSVQASLKAASIAAEYPDLLYSTAGVHPHDASSFDNNTSAQLEALARQPEVVAIGETGLDFCRDYSPRDIQERVFPEQLALAVKLQMPVFLHQRDAHSRFLGILREQRANLVNGVVHCFTGTREELFDYLDLDMYIGITGWVCDERRGERLVELLPSIPQDRLLLETDAPYLMPRNIVPRPRHRRNEPAHLPWVLAKVAASLQLDASDIAAFTAANTVALFGIAPVSAAPGSAC